MIFGYPFSDVLLSIGVDTRTKQKSIFTPIILQVPTYLRQAPRRIKSWGPMQLLP